MKKVTLSIVFVLTGLFFTVSAQTVDEIIDNYFENTGGREAWESLKGMKMTAKVNQGGMEIPIEIVQMKGGKQYTKMTFQGMDIMQGVFDGEIMWSMNMQTMEPEKGDAEMTERIKLISEDFPDAFLHYKEKGYKAELIGKETIDGAETFKVKLTKKPFMVDGAEVEDISFTYYEVESFVPIAQEQEVKMGPGKGMVQMITFSDYQEVEGLYFPFSMTQGVKDGQSTPITFDAIEVNPEIDDSVFDYTGK